MIVLRVGLVLFVLAWLFGPYELRTLVPIWLAFLIALGLELHYFSGAFRALPERGADRGPQEIDRERYGYESESDELLLVREEGLDALIEEARDPPEPTWSPPVRRRGRGLLVGLGVIAALALTTWVVESRTGWDAVDADARAAAEARFSAEASRIAGHKVKIRCDVSGEHVGAVQHTDGIAEVGGTLAYLAPERCLDLYRLAFNGEVRSSQTGRALAVLAHEAWHLRGERNEGTTECYALQSAVDIGRRFGLTDERARQLMRQQLVENTLHGGSSTE